MKKNETQLFKNQFVLSLAPFFDMLGNLYNEMDYKAWITMVRKTELSFKNNPTQYLGNDIPTPQITAKILEEIVNDFLNYYSIKGKREVAVLN